MTIAEAPRAELLTPEEVARVLKLSKSKVYGLIATNDLPGIVRIGRNVRVIRARLEAWIEQAGAA